jgi:hypothetical protein
MFGADNKPSPAVILVLGVVFGGGVWGFGLPFALKAAASGALGKVGETVFGWILKSSTKPEDLELQRQLALQRQAERERQAEFDRRQAELGAAHKRRMQELEAESRLKVAEDKIRDSDHRRKLEEQAQTTKSELERERQKPPNMTVTRNNPPAPGPVFVPPGACILVNEQFRCNRDTAPTANATSTQATSSTP